MIKGKPGDLSQGFLIWSDCLVANCSGSDLMALSKWALEVEL